MLVTPAINIYYKPDMFKKLIVVRRINDNLHIYFRLPEVPKCDLFRICLSQLGKKRQI